MTTDHGLFHRVFVAPESAWPLAIVRILLGIVLLGWTLAAMADVSTFLAPDGLVPIELADDSWRPLELGSSGSVWAALIIMALACLPIIAGFRPTIFLLIAFFIFTSVVRRDLVVVNSGDRILGDLVFLLALCPSAAAFSVDRWRRHGRASLRTAPQIAPWGMRLMQLQMMVVYFTAARSKSGALWHEGTAVSTVFRIEDLKRFEAPDLLIESVPLVAALTWGTLLLELALGLGLWNRKWRPALIIGGVVLHLTIELYVLIGFFSLAMICGLMVFLDGERVQRVVDRYLAKRTNTTLAAEETVASSTR